MKMRFDGMIWQDVIDFHTKSLGRRQQIVLRLFYHQILIYWKDACVVEKNKNDTDDTLNNKLGTTVGRCVD